MPEGQTPASGQAPAGTGSQGQAPQANNGGSPSTASQSPQAGGDNTQQSQSALTPAQYEAMVAELRKENASHRTKLKQFEDAQAAAELAKLSDADKAAKRAQTAEAALQTARGRIGAAELKAAASTAGIIDPDVAAALLGGKVEYDADGEPTNVADLVKQLKADKPHLFTTPGQQQQSQQRPPANSGGPANPGRQAGNGGLTREMIEAMSNRERAVRWQEIDAWRKANPDAVRAWAQEPQ